MKEWGTKQAYQIKKLALTSGTIIIKNNCQG